MAPAPPPNPSLSSPVPSPPWTLQVSCFVFAPQPHRLPLSRYPLAPQAPPLAPVHVVVGVEVRQPPGDLQAHPLQGPQVARGQLRGQALWGPLGAEVALQVPLGGRAGGSAPPPPGSHTSSQSPPGWGPPAPSGSPSERQGGNNRANRAASLLAWLLARCTTCGRSAHLTDRCQGLSHTSVP